MSLLQRIMGRGDAAPAPRSARVEPALSAAAAPTSGTFQPEPWLTQNWGGPQSRVKTLPRVTPDLAQRHATVTACCSVVAGDLAKLPLVVCQTIGPGREEPVADHPLNFLLNFEASEGVPAWVTRFGVNYAYLLRGEAFAWAPRDGGGSVAFWEQVQATVMRQGRARAYSFSDGGDMARRVVPRQMVHLRYMALDGWTGRSPLSVAAESIGLALAGQEAAAKTASGQTARAIAKLGAFGADDETWQRARRQFKQAMSEGDGGTVIIGQEDDYKSVGLSAADMELLATRKFDREQIAAVYRVPPSKLQMLEHGVKANGQQQAIDYRTDCLLHWATPIEAGMGMSLLTAAERAAGLVLRHDYDLLLTPTTKEKFEAYARAVGGPFMSWQEARRLQGLKDLPPGEQPYPPSNMTRDENAAKEKDDDE